MAEQGDFNWALSQLEIGHRVRCETWSEWGLYICVEWVRNHRYPNGERVIFIYNIDGERLRWHARQSEVEPGAVWTRVHRVPGQSYSYAGFRYFVAGSY